MAKGVLIVGEVFQGSFSPINAELLGQGRRLANDLGEELIALLIGASLGDSGKKAIGFGADKAYLVDNAALANYSSDAYSELATGICKELAPSILLLGQTDVGRDLAPRLASRLNTGLCMDCVDLSIDLATKLMLQTRPVYGGNANATYICRRQPQMATIRVKSMAPAEYDASRSGEVVSLERTVDPAVIKAKLLNRVEEEGKGVKLEEADVVVGGGRGVGNAENFAQLYKLAELFKGAVGGTRAAIDEKWLPTQAQIGLTGKIIAPKVYFAIALSGAMQHVAGCSGAKTIVAINRDPDANIFKVCHFGIVCDWKEAVPALIEKFKELGT